MLIKSLNVSVMTPCAPNVVLVDAGHLLYHVVWPVSGTTGDLAASFGPRQAHYPPVSKKIILFDRYDQDAPSAKYHERTRRGRANEVRLTPNTFIPCREEVILHNSKNKNLLNQTLCSYPLPHNTQHSSTCRTVSLMISTSSFSWCTGHQGCELSPRFKWKIGMAMSWTSMKLFSG